MLARYTQKMARYLRTTRAVSALEYALLIGVIAVVVGVALTALGTNVKTAIDKAAKSVTTATTNIK